MKKIPKSEFLEHFEDDDLLEVYGDPVAVEDEKGNVLVFLSKELYQKLVKDMTCDDVLDTANAGWIEWLNSNYYPILRGFDESNRKAIKELALTMHADGHQH